jgi:hypothetical protein
MVERERNTQIHQLLYFPAGSRDRPSTNQDRGFQDRVLCTFLDSGVLSPNRFFVAAGSSS